jgi:hypothetical protein
LRVEGCGQKKEKRSDDQLTHQQLLPEIINAMHDGRRHGNLLLQSAGALRDRWYFSAEGRLSCCPARPVSAAIR